MSVHSSLTGADLHESKGVAAASANTVAVANGSGTTTWELITRSSLDTTTIKGIGLVYFSGFIPNISTLNSNCVIPIPFNCLITNILYTLDGAITVGNGSITAANPGVGAMATTTIPFSGSALGSSTNQPITTANTVASGSYIEIYSNAGPTGATALYFTMTVQLT